MVSAERIGTMTATQSGSTHIWPRGVWSALAILLLAAALRAVMLGRDVRFHADEALYASYARSMALHGNWLVKSPPVPLDKPPLGLLLTASGFLLAGVSEFGGRVPTWWVSVLGVAVSYRLATRFAGWRTGLLTGLLAALSPFDTAFSATLFHDPLLTLLLSAAALSLSLRRWGLAGLLAAASLATKQSAIQFLPLFLGVGLWCGWQRRPLRRQIAAFCVLFAAGLSALLIWSAARAEPVDFWTLGITNPGQIRLIRAEEVLPRLVRWGQWLALVVGFPTLLLAAWPLLSRLNTTQTLTARLVLGGVLLTLFGDWLLAFNTYDRYLLPLCPLIAYLTAWSLARLPRLATLATVMLLVPLLWLTVSGRLAIGGSRPGSTDILEVAAAIRQLPAGAVVEQYWLDWELAFYLGDPQAANLPTLRFQPGPEAAARAVCSAADQPHYLALYAGMASRWLHVINTMGVSFTPMFTGDILLFELACGE